MVSSGAKVPPRRECPGSQDPWIERRERSDWWRNDSSQHRYRRWAGCSPCPWTPSSTWYVDRFSGASFSINRGLSRGWRWGPTLLVAIPFTVLVSFTLNILLRELGAADLSGAGAAFGAVTQVGPMVTVLIVAGAGATAMCADLGGSRTIREEIDAMEVLGINRCSVW